MSRSVSAPSSVTKTSPCWNGLIVPGSTFRYGSNFCAWTRSPRAFRSRPSEAATIPFPSAETTPPVTKMYLVWVSSAWLMLLASLCLPPQGVELSKHRRPFDQRTERTSLAEEGETRERRDRAPALPLREPAHGP